MSKAKKILYLICSIIIGFGIVFVSWNYFSDLSPTTKEQIAERTMIIEEINKHPVQATPEERFDIIEKINSF